MLPLQKLKSPILIGEMIRFKKYSLLTFFFICTTSLVFGQEVGPDDKTISIYFGGGSYFIDEEQESDLIRFIEDTDNLALYHIEVHGHTDNIGSHEFNQYLSHMRCENVIYTLEQLFIEPETIFQYDHGETNPDYSNDTWNGKLHNRRVDVILRKLAL